MVPAETLVNLLDLFRTVQAHKVDAQFAADLTAIQSDQPSLPEDPWDSSSTPAF